MKRINILSIPIVILLIIIVVFVRSQQEIVRVNLVSETMNITYTDTESLQIFQEAIRTVKKVPGAVDVGPPTYRMTVTYEDTEVAQYSLYMNFKTKNGFLIKNSNSERMLDLRDKNSAALADLLSSVQGE